MTQELARAIGEPTEDEYERFCATVMTTARGRWFLAEYARRHRKADTGAVLEALHKIEDMVRARPEPALERLRDEMRALAAMVRETRRDLAVSGGVVSDATKVMMLLDLLAERIDFALVPGDDRTPLAPPPASDARPHLTIVAPVAVPAPLPERIAPPPVEFTSKAPEPIKPAPLPPAAMAHVVALPSAKRAEPTPPPALGPDELYVPFEIEPLPQELPEPPPALVRPNTFADVMALSEAERVALFS